MRSSIDHSLVNPIIDHARSTLDYIDLTIDHDQV